MEEWRISRFIDVDDETGEQRQIGGGISCMQIGAVNGSLREIDVKPTPVEQMQEENWDSQFVRFQVADRVVWMTPEEVEILVELLKLAHDAALNNYASINQ